MGVQSTVTRVRLAVTRVPPPVIPGDIRAAFGRARGRPWRAAVAEGSMRPAIEPGDWLLLDPTVVGWPRRGSVVVVREPGSDLLAIKRVAARGGDHVHLPEGLLHLEPGEAWLLGDAADVSVDSRRYGPLDADRLVARAWFRCWPPRRLGRIRPRR